MPIDTTYDIIVKERIAATKVELAHDELIHEQDLNEALLAVHKDSSDEDSEESSHDEISLGECDCIAHYRRERWEQGETKTNLYLRRLVSRRKTRSSHFFLAQGRLE